MEPKASYALIVVNLGTPDAPDEESIRRFLKQFLSDPRVVDFPRWLWLPILNRIILKNRPKRLVEDYSFIWGGRAGPILETTLSSIFLFLYIVSISDYLIFGTFF